ncbi:MAG: ATP-binding protein, partial [archaeon]|nr:ATP-binding protein [archaeon]
NNLKVDNILSARSGERFGFTGPEVERLCSDYGHPEKYGEAKDWYDGYRFGNADVYNPWSVLNYVDEGFVAKAYWASTSGNDIIPRLLDNADIKTYGNLEKLGRRDPVTIQMNETVAYSQLTTDSDTLFSVMAMSGYLNAVRDEDDDVSLSIPNRELCSVFSYEMLKRVISDDKHVPKFMNALLRCDVEKMGLHLGALTDTILSVRHLGDGKTHHAFLAGLLTAAATCYDITTDREGGDGYPDIMMRCVRGNTPHVIIEVKETSDKDRWDSVSKEALKQIHDKEYYRGLKGKVILYGVAFYLKTPKITSEIIDR